MKKFFPSKPKEAGDKVVALQDFRAKKPEFVFECTCGSQLFFLHYDGTIECRSCKHIRETIEWTYRK